MSVKNIGPRWSWRLVLVATVVCGGLSLVQSSPLAAAEIPQATPESVGMSSAKLAKVDATMQQLVDSKRLAGAQVLVARRGKLVFDHCYGFQDLESKQPMQPDTIYRLYSMTKAITCAGALVLVDEGKLGLDDPVSRYLPEFRALLVNSPEGPRLATKVLTVRQLFLHTAGFNYGESGSPATDQLFQRLKPMDINLDLAEMTARMSKIPVAFEPGEDWLYGTSIDVLGRVVEVAAGMPLDQFLSERLFKPLDMRDIGFSVPRDKVSRFASCYKSDEKGTLTLDDAANRMEFLTPPRLLRGGGGLVGTGRDYLRFLMAIAQGGQLDNRRVLSEKSVQLMTTNGLPESIGSIKFGKQVRQGVGFGLGFNVRFAMSDWDPQGRVGEYGWGGAASTHYWVSPRDELIVVTLEQTFPYSFMTEFAIKGLIYDACER